MGLQRIELTDSPGQKFSTIVGGVRVAFRFRYNVTIYRFMFDIEIDDTIVLQGRIMEPDVDLVAAFPEIAKIIGVLFCVDIDERNREPTIENIVSGDVRIFMISS